MIEKNIIKNHTHTHTHQLLFLNLYSNYFDFKRVRNEFLNLSLCFCLFNNCHLHISKYEKKAWHIL